jgi:cell division protein FtsI/penicillin-binding protein 2
MPPLQKTNRLLQIFLTAFLLIGLRVWHLAVIQREEKLQAAKCPQQRTIVSKANRGCIVDRFGIPLAQNRICYTVSVYYSQFSQIPSLGWKINEEGKRERTYPRKEHIHNLSLLLGQELSLPDTDRRFNPL